MLEKKKERKSQTLFVIPNSCSHLGEKVDEYLLTSTGFLAVLFLSINENS